MARVLIAAVSALFLGAVVTELHSRVFPGRYTPLLLLTTVAVFVGGLFAARVATRIDGRSARARPDVGPARTRVTPSDTDADLETGRVKWFNRTKGFGFIVRADGSEIFVHHRNVHGNARHGLKDGELVRFKVAAHAKGLQAEQVSVVTES